MKLLIKPYTKDQWHPWFAWYPVEVHGYRVWLETIMRRRRGEEDSAVCGSDAYYWEYSWN